MTTELKSIYWSGASKAELLQFPEDALQDAGYQLHLLQKGNTPQDWKPLTGLGKGISGVYEIRIWESKKT
jgi:phage-related protein